MSESKQDHEQFMKDFHEVITPVKDFLQKHILETANPELKDICDQLFEHFFPTEEDEKMEEELPEDMAIFHPKSKPK